MSINDTTGVDFISVTAGEKSIFTAFEREHIPASNHEDGMAITIPMTILKSESPVKIQNLRTVESSNSLIMVSMGEGSMSGLAINIDAICHKAAQNRATPSDSAAFFSAFI